MLGVGGGIAAYKSAELARALMERGLRVQVVLTDAAQRFITPLTFAALTGRKVITNLYNDPKGAEADKVARLIYPDASKPVAAASATKGSSAGKAPEGALRPSALPDGTYEAPDGTKHTVKDGYLFKAK